MTAARENEWDEAQLHSMAGSSLNPAEPERAVWMSMFLVQQREIDELRKELEEVQESGE